MDVTSQAMKASSNLQRRNERRADWVGRKEIALVTTTRKGKMIDMKKERKKK
jgi:hypothetical protein